MAKGFTNQLFIYKSYMETIVSCLSLTEHRRHCDLHSNNCVCLLKQTNNQRQSGWLVLWEEEEVWVEASTESGEADHIGLKINCHEFSNHQVSFER